MTQAQVAAIRAMNSYLAGAEIEYEESTPGTFVALLPGERKLKTTVSLVVGEHGLSINAFVVRNPDENHGAIYKWLLERNRRLFAVAYALDHLGDIYLVAKLPLEAITPDSLDRLMGSVLENSDSVFNQLLELGFASAIRREWKWRRHRGESTANLAAFAHLADPLDPDTA